MYRVLDLFSGIGGFSLGLERTGGFKTVAFCEIDPYCQKVLKKHWSDVPCYDDIRELTGIEADVICGGFPCQDISLAGRRAGLDGARSGLWGELFRLVCELRPRYAIVENTPGLLSLGMDRVLGDLASVGYDAEWDCIPAAAVGAPHLRDRIWIVAYAAGSKRKRFWPKSCWQPDRLANHRGWPTEPGVGRVVHGLSGRVDRIRALGNAVVPQIPELIGRAILEAEKEIAA